MKMNKQTDEQSSTDDPIDQVMEAMGAKQYGPWVLLDELNKKKVQATRRAAEARGQEPAIGDQETMLGELGIQTSPRMTKAEAEALIYDALIKEPEEGSS
jgi:hypothetical protein